MLTLTLPQGSIRYRDEGPPDRPAVVFVHGALVNGSLWRDVVPTVVDHGFRAIVPDLPLGSQAEAMAPDADLSPRGVARMIVELLERLDLTDVTLVANDTGGAITQLLLDTDARRVGRVVFTNCDTFERFPPPPFDLLFKLGRLPGFLSAMVLATRSTFVRHHLGFGLLARKPLDPEQTRDWLHGATTDPDVRRDLRRFAASIDPADLVDAATRLERFEGPVLLAWAPEDRYFRIADGRRLAACFQQARVVEIPDSKTFVAHDQPARLAAEIVTFVRSTTTRTPAR